MKMYYVYNSKANTNEALLVADATQSILHTGKL